MFKSDSELSSLLDHPNNGAIVKIIGQGQDDRADRTPTSETRKHRTIEEKADIALLAAVVGIKGAAELVGATPGVVGRIASGEKADGTPDPTLGKEIKDRLQGSALVKAEGFLGKLDPEGNLRDQFKLAHIAEKAVTIYEKLAPKVPPNQQNIQVVFYAPKARESSDYQVLEVEPQKG